jgi:ABC-type dipeptide/oligopeptide/nickel transport system permease component
VVPQELVLGQPPLEGALEFGFEMGTGLRTHMPSNLPYLGVAVGVLIPPWWSGLVLGLGFALGRLTMTTGRTRNADWENQWLRWKRVVLIALNLFSACLVVAAMWNEIHG